MQGSVGLAHNADLQKIVEIPKGNKGFRQSVALAHNVDPQKIDLKLTPIWGRKSLKFLV